MQEDQKSRAVCRGGEATVQATAPGIGQPSAADSEAWGQIEGNRPGILAQHIQIVFPYALLTVLASPDLT